MVAVPLVRISGGWGALNSKKKAVPFDRIGEGCGKLNGKKKEFLEVVRFPAKN